MYRWSAGTLVARATTAAVGATMPDSSAVGAGCGCGADVHATARRMAREVAVTTLITVR
jgi:hypothetical protein